MAGVRYGKEQDVTEQHGRSSERRLAARAGGLLARPDARPSAPVDPTAPTPATPPPAAVAAALAALERGETHYTSGSGILPLREAIAERSTADGFPVAPSEVVVTNGGAEALYLALQTALPPGERLLIAGPVPPRVRQMARFIGAEPVDLTGPLDDALRQASGRVLLLASPSPSSGVALPPVALARAAALAVERGLTVILDRSRAWCAFDSALATFPDGPLARQVITTGSFSLAYDLSGWRCGYVAVPAGAARVGALKEAMSICTSAISQQAALAALREGDAGRAERRATLARRRDWLLAELRAAGLDALRPDAWPTVAIDTRLVHPDDREAARLLAEQAAVRVDPAGADGPALRGYVRINLTAPEEVLREGVRRLESFHNACM